MGNKGRLYSIDISQLLDDPSVLQLIFSDHLGPHCFVKDRTGKTRAPKPDCKSRQNMSV